MGDESRHPRQRSNEATTGRTTADAAVDIATLLGKSLPVLVAVGGVLYAYLEFRSLEQSADARVDEAAAKARAQSQAELEDANKNMREAYKLGADMSAQAVASTKSVVDVQSQIAARAREQLEALIETQRKVFDETKKLEAAQLDARAATEKAAAAVEETVRAQAELSKAQLERASVISERDGARRELDQAREQATTLATKRAGDVQLLRTKLSELVAGILEEDSDPEEVRELAINVRADLLVEPAEFLAAFARADLDMLAADYFDPLIGCETAKLSELLKTPSPDRPFAFWAEVGSIEGGVYARDGYVGCLRQGEDGLYEAVYFESSGERVTDIDWVRSLRGMCLRNADSWENTNLWILIEEPRSGGTTRRSAESDSPSFSKATWSIRDVGDLGDELSLLSGSVQELKLLDPQAQERVEPFREDEEFDEAYRMTLRAESYDEQLQGDASLARIEDAELRGRFAGLLRAAVTLDATAVRPYSRTEWRARDLGKIASVALHPSFSVIDVVPARNESTPAQHFQQVVGQQVSIQVNNQRAFGPPQVAQFRFVHQGNELWMYLGLDFALSPEYQFPVSRD